MAPSATPAYLSALEDKLRPRLTSTDNFQMPDLSILHTKAKQIQVLREVQNSAVRFFTHMEEDIEHSRKLLQHHQPGHKRAKCVSFVIYSKQNAQNRYLLEPPQRQYQQPQPVIFQKSSYLAEQTISQYKHNLPLPPFPSRLSGPNPPPPTRFVQATGKYYP